MKFLIHKNKNHKKINKVQMKENKIHVLYVGLMKEIV